MAVSTSEDERDDRIKVTSPKRRGLANPGGVVSADPGVKTFDDVELKLAVDLAAVLCPERRKERENEKIRRPANRTNFHSMVHFTPCLY